MTAFLDRRGKGGMKGLSPLIATVIIVVLVIALSNLIIPWAYQLTYSITNRTAGDAMKDVECQAAAFELDSSYGSGGLLWDFTGATDTLSARLTNTGRVGIYNFSFQVTFNETSAVAIRSFPGNDTTNVRKTAPLLPGRSAIVHAAIGADYAGTPVLVKVTNEACPRVFRETQV